MRGTQELVEWWREIEEEGEELADAKGGEEGKEGEGEGGRGEEEEEEELIEEEEEEEENDLLDVR